MLDLLESLSPEQRAMLLLHDVLTTGIRRSRRSSARARTTGASLATRARRHVKQRWPRFQTTCEQNGDRSEARPTAERRDGFDDPGTGQQSRMLDYDAELRLHNERLREACEIGPSDRVLDIGCGAGQTTREAARVAAAGHAHGVDSSAVMIERARQLSREERVRNVTFQHADAEVCRFTSEPFDVAISRFGTMFFADPKAAFANIRRGLRSSARLVMMVWQDHERNEWSVAIERAASVPGATVQPSERGPDPFSLADPTHVERILDFAGFSKVTFDEVHEPVFYGRDADAALEFVTGLQSTRQMLFGLDERSASEAVERLRQVLSTHQTGKGVWLDSRAWIVTAQRR
jgi:SAM-dependent methyltransferase